MTLMFAAVVPSSLRSVKTSSQYNLAAQVAQRKLDQLMDPDVGYYAMTSAGLKDKVLSSSTTGGTGDACEWFDPDPAVSGTAPVKNDSTKIKTLAKKDYTLVGYFTKIDGLRKYKSNGTSACSDKLSQNAFPGDSDVEGKMEIKGWQGTTSSMTDSPLLQVTVTITWRTHGQGKSTYTTSTLIPENNIL